MNHETLQIFGRPNSINVQKVRWLLAELDIGYRYDPNVGGPAGYPEQLLAQNPNRRVPVLVHGDRTVWESNTILRYLARTFAADDSLYPGDPWEASLVDRWLDWQQTRLAEPTRAVFIPLVREGLRLEDLPQARQAAVQESLSGLEEAWKLFEHAIAAPPAADSPVSLVDIAVGVYAWRWTKLPAAPSLSPRLRDWIDALSKRSAFQDVVARHAG